MSKEKFKISENVFDDFTLEILKKGEAKGFFYMEELSPLYTGKEANIFLGEGSKGEVVIKIYRMENCNFNKMYDYIKLDSRLTSLKRKKRSVVLSWVQREFSNLLKAREFNVKSPTPYLVKGNIIVMERIHAQQLNHHPPKNSSRFYQSVIKEISKLLKAGMVHGDISQFNILNYKERPFLIDFSQATTTKSTGSKSLLERDITNINNFFKKLGVKEKELKNLEDFLS